jgi:methylmalonyl-CoA/ethylmalonyl-CoA epimerase
MNQSTRLHHVGFVVACISDGVEGFMKCMGADWDREIFHDPLQKAKVTFLRTPCPSDALIELVEPAGEGSPVLHFLQKGGGLHHLCYEVEDLDAHLISMRLNGAVVVRRALPAIAFQNRRIAWALTGQKLLLEFLERGKLSGV